MSDCADFGLISKACCDGTVLVICQWSLTVFSYLSYQMFFFLEK